MVEIAKILIFFGILMIIIGLILLLGIKFFPLGNLPGDILIKKYGCLFYFPLVTCIIISIIVSIILTFILRFFLRK